MACVVRSWIRRLRAFPATHGSIRVEGSIVLPVGRGAVSAGGWHVRLPRDRGDRRSRVDAEGRILVLDCVLPERWRHAHVGCRTDRHFACASAAGRHGRSSRWRGLQLHPRSGPRRARGFVHQTRQVGRRALGRRGQGAQGLRSRKPGAARADAGRNSYPRQKKARRGEAAGRESNPERTRLRTPPGRRASIARRSLRRW